MELHDKMGYRKAVIVDENMLLELDKCIKRFFPSLPQYSADLIDESTINFESLEELLQYDNFGDKSIKFLRITFGYSNRIVFKQTSSLIHSYKYSLSIEYITKSVNDSTLFKKELFNIFEKGRRSWYYTFITKFSLMYVFMTLFFLLAIFYGVSYLKGILKVSDTELSVGIFDIWLISITLIILGTHLLSQIRTAVFPVVAYKIGEQKKQIERRDDLLSKFFWGVIVAGVVSAIISVLI